MDSTFQLLNSPNVSNELINGQNSSGFVSSIFQKCDRQAVSVGIGIWSDHQFQRSHDYASSVPRGIYNSGSIAPVTFNSGKRNPGPTSTKVWRRISPIDDADKHLQHLQNADEAREAVIRLKGRVQQGISIDSYTYVYILQKVNKQKDLVLAKQVHECIIQSEMEQHPYVANKLMSIYIRCGSLQNARQVFDRLVEKNIFNWTIMIGGYAENNQFENAIEVYDKMRRDGVHPNEITFFNVLKACTYPVALKWGRKIHDHIRQAGFQSDLRLGNALIHMYARCGSMDDARLVFSGMVDRDIITWNVMIGRLVQHGRGHEAFSLFLQMQREGFVPDVTTYLSMLNANACSGALGWVKEVHNHALRAGLESDVRVGTALVHMYAKSGSIKDARLVFDKMTERNIITWNAMIGGFAQHGCGLEAFFLFLQMQREGLVPDAITYVNILNNACASTGALEWVRKVHDDAAKVGLDFDVRVGNALVHMYAKCGSMDDARRVFYGMVDRDVVSWTVMIGGLAQHGFGREAFSLFLQMQREGFVPNLTTYLSILNGKASTGALDWVKEVHSHAIIGGLDSHLRVGNALIHMYAKCGSIEKARLVFDKMADHDIISWNAMIGGLAQNGHGREAFSHFLQMQREGFIPDAATLVSILNACASTRSLDKVKEVHSYTLKAGLESDLRVGSALVHTYAKCGSIDDARLVFERMASRDNITWNVMIGGLAQHGREHEAFSLFLQMEDEGFVPDAITYLSLLGGNASVGALEWVKEVHKHVVRAGFDTDSRVFSALVHMYTKCGDIDNAKRVSDGMIEANPLI